MPTPHSPTAVLRREHQLILDVLAVIERLIEPRRSGESYDFDAIADCASFFRLFADACHHGKEEDLLFPELEARGIPREGGPIGVMLDEHRRGRAFVRLMIEHLPRAREGDAEALGSLLDASASYVQLLRNHIAKEDNILFMMADRVVDAPACAALCGRYAQVCARKFEGRTKQQLEQLAARLGAAEPNAS